MRRNLGTVVLQGEQCSLEIGRYPAKPHCLLLMAIDEEGAPFAKLTMNIDGYGIKEGAEHAWVARCLVLKTHSWGDRWAPLGRELLRTGWFIETGIGALAGYCEYPIWRITAEGLDRLRALDPDFFDQTFPDR